MRQNPNALRTKYPSYYRQDILEWKRGQLGWSQRETARRAKINIETVKKVFKGLATGTKVYPVVNALGLNWTEIHNLTLKPSEFQLAVRNGGSER